MSDDLKNESTHPVYKVCRIVIPIANFYYIKIKIHSLTGHLYPIVIGSLNYTII